MGLTRTALIFAAGYVLGRPEGRAKVAQLAQRPEVTQLRDQAATKVSSGWQSGKQQLTKATHRANKQADEVSSTSNGSGPDYSPPRRRRLPSFPRRGAQPAPSEVTSTAPVGTTPATATSSGTPTVPVAGDRASTSTTATVTGPTTSSPAAPSDQGSTSPATASGKSEVPPAASTPPVPPRSATDRK
jgi:hypothetical protein